MDQVLQIKEGTVLYEMLIGMPPYYSDDIPSLYKLIQDARLSIPKNISEEAKSLLKVIKINQELLKRDPSKRIGCKNKDEIKSHPFFKSIDWDKLKKRDLPPPSFESDYDEEVLNIKQENVNFRDLDYDESNYKFNRVPEWSFIR